jgi:CRISPR-associated protein Cas1
MVKLEEVKPDDHPDSSTRGFSFDFEGRTRRPPRDPVNAPLWLACSMLAKDLTVACYAVGFDPYMGFYHQLRTGVRDWLWIWWSPSGPW